MGSNYWESSDSSRTCRDLSNSAAAACRISPISWTIKGEGLQTAKRLRSLVSRQTNKRSDFRAIGSLERKIYESGRCMPAPTAAGRAADARLNPASFNHESSRQPTGIDAAILHHRLIPLRFWSEKNLSDGLSSKAAAAPDRPIMQVECVASMFSYICRFIVFAPVSFGPGQWSVCLRDGLITSQMDVGFDHFCDWNWAKHERLFLVTIYQHTTSILWMWEHSRLGWIARRIYKYNGVNESCFIRCEYVGGLQGFLLLDYTINIFISKLTCDFFFKSEQLVHVRIFDLLPSIRSISDHLPSLNFV